MNTKEILGGNKLIATFMNVHWTDDKDPFMSSGINYIFPTHLEYHTSWDWLMPACKKFDRLDEAMEYVGKVRDEYENLCFNVDIKVNLYEILPAFNALVEAIKWYNAHK